MRATSTAVAVVAMYSSAVVVPGAAAMPPPERSVTVSVTPPYGAWPRGLSTTFSMQEARIVSDLHGVVDALSETEEVPRATEYLNWHVEPSASASPLLALARRSLVETQLMFERAGIFEVQRTDVVVGRTQAFLDSTVRSLGCNPDLSRTGGAYLMGASLCGNSIITMDLTGLIFLVRAGQRLSPWMEAAPEPPIASLPYQVVDRAVAVLSHEWAHAVRFAVAGATHVPGEPVWFREGFSEWVALASRTKAFAPEMSYLDAHAMRVHLFSNWPSRCESDPSAYRNRPSSSVGCEYFVGLLAVELLAARFGGFGPLVEVHRLAAGGLRFQAAFRAVYGMSLADFEERATAYVSGVAASMAR